LSPERPLTSTPGPERDPLPWPKMDL